MAAAAKLLLWAAAALLAVAVAGGTRAPGGRARGPNEACDVGERADEDDDYNDYGTYVIYEEPGAGGRRADGRPRDQDNGNKSSSSAHSASGQQPAYQVLFFAAKSRSATSAASPALGGRNQVAPRVGKSPLPRPLVSAAAGESESRLSPAAAVAAALPRGAPLSTLMHGRGADLNGAADSPPPPPPPPPTVANETPNVNTSSAAADEDDYGRPAARRRRRNHGRAPEDETEQLDADDARWLAKMNSLGGAPPYADEPSDDGAAGQAPSLTWERRPDQSGRLMAPSARPEHNKSAAEQEQEAEAQVDARRPHNVYYWRLVWLVLPLGATFGNLLVIMAVYLERSLQSVTNYFIVSLAFADLFVGLIVMPFAVYVLVNEVWELSDTICDIFVAVDVTSSTASILNLVAISIDRYLAVAHPIAYSAGSSSTRAIITICMVWLISCCVGAPIILGLNTSPERQPTLCILYNSTFIFWSSLTSFYVPCIVMIGLYWRIFLAIRSRTKKAIGAAGHHASRAKSGAGPTQQQRQLPAQIAPLGTCAGDKLLLGNGLEPTSPPGEPPDKLAVVASTTEPSPHAQTSGSSNVSGSSSQESKINAAACPPPLQQQPTPPDALKLGGAPRQAAAMLQPLTSAAASAMAAIAVAAPSSAGQVGGARESDGATIVLERVSRCDTDLAAAADELIDELGRNSSSRPDETVRNQCHTLAVVHALLRSSEAVGGLELAGLDGQATKGQRSVKVKCWRADSATKLGDGNQIVMDSVVQRMGKTCDSATVILSSDCARRDSNGHKLNQNDSSCVCCGNLVADELEKRPPRPTVALVIGTASGHQLTEVTFVTSRGVGKYATPARDDHPAGDLKLVLVVHASGKTMDEGEFRWRQLTLGAESQLCAACAASCRLAQIAEIVPSAIGANQRERTSNGAGHHCSHPSEEVQSESATPSGQTSSSSSGSPLSLCSGHHATDFRFPAARNDCCRPAPAYCSSCLQLVRQEQEQRGNRLAARNWPPESPCDHCTECAPPDSRKLSAMSVEGHSANQHPEMSSCASTCHWKCSSSFSGPERSGCRRLSTTMDSSSNCTCQDLESSSPHRQLALQSRELGARCRRCDCSPCHELERPPTADTRGALVKIAAAEVIQLARQSPAASSADRATSASPASANPATPSGTQSAVVVIQNATERIKRRSMRLRQLIRGAGSTGPKQPDEEQPCGQLAPSEDEPFSSSCATRPAARLTTTASGVTTSEFGVSTITSSSGEGGMRMDALAAKTDAQQVGAASERRPRDAAASPSTLTAGSRSPPSPVKLHRHRAPAAIIGALHPAHQHQSRELASQPAKFEAGARPKLALAGSGANSPAALGVGGARSHRAGSRRRREKNAARRERKATKTLAIVLGIFLICWTPFFTCNIIDGICIQLNVDCRPGMMVYLVTSWLGYVNSCVNPIIYTIFNMEFRRAFKRILTTRPECRCLK